MAKERKYHTRDVGRKVICRVVSIRGHCDYGLKIGDEFEVSAISSGGICGYLYHNIYPFVMVYQFGGRFPESRNWPGDRIEVFCPDVIGCVRVQLRPEGIDDVRHPIYLKDQVEEEKRWCKKLGLG